MDNRIVTKTRLSEKVWRIRVDAPLIARHRKAGQFVILRVDAEWGERIPLTIADADAEAGTIDLVYQTVGETTQALAKLNVGDTIANVVGPLGKPTEIEVEGGRWKDEGSGEGGQRRIVVVGGGVGIAPAHPIAQAFKAAGNHVTSILGGRTKDLVIMEDEMRRASDEVIVVTDDGSYGRKGLVTEPLKELCETGRVDEAVLIGPPVMMKFAALTTKPFGVKTIASLNSIMIDGTGMCGGCRVTVGGQTKFVCVDGPEFDAHQVDFDNLILRSRTFAKEEKEHRCRLMVSG